MRVDNKICGLMQRNPAVVRLISVGQERKPMQKESIQKEPIQKKLIQRAQKGDAEAFITLMEQSKEKMKRIAFSYLKQEEDVADAMQDTVLDAFEHIHDLKKTEYFQTWLTRILINNCTDIYRKNMRSASGSAEAAQETYGVRAQDSAGAGAQAEGDLVFWDLLEQLPRESRPIFQLYFGEQYTTAQIADLLELNENTVKSRLRRGKEQLRKSI